MSQIMIEEVILAVGELHDLSEEISKKRGELKLLTDSEEKLERKIMGILEDTGLKSFKSPYGTVTLANRFSVKFPKEPEVKKDLETWLRERNVFEGMWSVNYATLNSFFKAEMEAAERENRMVDVPGLEPTSESYLQFRKG
jgi:hypothetical protein